MNLLTRIDNLKRLWSILLPAIDLPSDRQLGMWAMQFTDEELEYAVTRTSRKKFDVPKTSEMVHRYCTGVLSNQRRNNTKGVVQK